MHRFMIRGFAVAAVAAVAAVVLAAWTAARADEEEKISLDKLPKAVADAVKDKYPGAELVGAEKENENGKTAYEIKIKDKGKKLEVSFTPAGVLTTVEEEIDAKALPKEVTDALDAKYPKASIQKAEEVTEGGKKTYEVRIKTADKKSLEVELDPKGKILETEDKGKD